MRRGKYIATAVMVTALTLTLLGCAGPSGGSQQPTAAAPAAQPTSGAAVQGATPAAAAPTTTGGPSISTLPKVSGTVKMMGVWGADELNNFRSVAAQWEQQTGGKMEFEG